MMMQRLNTFLVLTALCLLSACGGNGGNASRSKDVDHALAYMPDDALAVVSGSVDRLLASDLWKKLQAEIPNFDESVAEMKENVGIAPSDISRVTAAIISPKEGDVIVVLQTKRDISIEDVKKIKDFKDLPFAASKIGSAEVYTAGPMPFTLHFPDARTLVVGQSAAMTKMLSRAAPAPTANMKASLEMARFDKVLTIVTSIKGMPQEAKDKLMADAPQEAAPILAMLISANSMSMNADATDVIDLAIEADFPEVANAQSLFNMVEGLKAMAMASPELPKEASDMLNQIKSEVDGSVFRVSAKIDPSMFLAPLAKARGTARNMQSATQVRGLQQACVLWSNSANEKFPPSLGVMLPDEYFTVEYVISPLHTTVIPADFNSWEDAKKIEWVNKNSSYCYVTGHIDDNDSQKITVFERLLDPTRKTIPVGFNDNHVETLPVAEASAKIKAQTGRTLEEWSKAPNPGAGGK